MKTERKIPGIIILLSLLFSLRLTAQTSEPSINRYDYKNAIGVRIGETSGFTYKHHFNNGNAFEGIISAWPYAVGLTGLYEKHIQTGAPGLLFYVGGGGHVNFGGPEKRYYRYYGDTRYAYSYRSGGFAAGLDGIIGLEYKIKPIPLGLSFDIKPYTEVNDFGNVFMAIDPSLGVKFTF